MDFDEGACEEHHHGVLRQRFERQTTDNAILHW